MARNPGRGGLLLAAVLMGATLLSISTPAAASPPAETRNLNLRLPGASPAGRASAWVLGDDRGEAQPSLRAAHLLASDRVGPVASGRRSRLLVVPVVVAREAPKAVLTNAATVGALLDALGVRLGGLDIVRPATGAPLGPRSEVEVLRVRQVTETVRRPIPFRTLTQYSKDVPRGETRVLAPGSTGVEVRTFLVTYRNGRKVASRPLTQRVLTAAADRVELLGTGPAPAPAPATSPRTETGDATWYDCAGMHAAHKTLPFGTAVTVTNLDNGRSVTVTINDRGPYAAGRIIDLCTSAFSAIAPLGQGVARVSITW